MTEIHALSGAYAVDALDDIERAAFERHLAECPACQSEVAGLREAAAMMGATVPVQPSAGLRDRVLADIATVRPLPPSVDRSATASTAGGRTRFRPRALLAAAAAVIALGAGAAVVQPWDDGTVATPTAAQRVAAADDATTNTQEVGGATATLVVSEQLNEAVLVTTDMPEAPEGKVYELWLDHEGIGMVPAGLMTDPDSPIVLEGDPATAVGAGITVEPAGGSPKPTSEPIVVVPFKQA